ncbi:MAG: hypothetical protein H6734_06595 [Alphaproteobacteria bacterium]|nr:hypothetical protein [Alphaproteobacteria bacterium]
MLLFVLGCLEGRAPVEVDVVFQPVEGALPAGVQVDVLDLDVGSLRVLADTETYAWVPSLVPSAHAHPGHELAGDVRVELQGRRMLDGLGPVVDLGLADGWTGDVATARLELHAVSVSGSVTTADGGVLPFALELDVERGISGIPVDAVLRADIAQTFVLAFDPGAALAPVVWEDEDGDGRLTADDTQFVNTVVFGLTSLNAWSLEAE